MERPPARSFQDLLVWKRAHRVVLDVYRFSSEFPAPETYGLRSQLRRAAVSVPANIAEAFKKRSRADKARVMNIAESSLEETRYYLILARDLEYGASSALLEQVDEVGRLLSAYAQRVRSGPHPDADLQPDF